MIVLVTFFFPIAHTLPVFFYSTTSSYYAFDKYNILLVALKSVCVYTIFVIRKPVINQLVFD